MAIRTGLWDFTGDNKGWFDPGLYPIGWFDERLVPDTGNVVTKDLTAATFSFSAKTLQLSLNLKPSSSLFTFTPKEPTIAGSRALTVGTFTWTAYPIQLNQYLVPSSATLTFTGKTILDVLRYYLGLAGNLNFTAQSIQLVQTVNPSAPQFLFTAHAIAYGAQAVEELSAATFTFTSKAPQNTQTLHLGAATFSIHPGGDIEIWVAGEPIAGRLKIRPLIGVGV